MIQVSYQCHDDSEELVNHERSVATYGEVCELIDDFPWVREAELFEKHGEGSALFFRLGDLKGKHAYFQFTPLGVAEGALDLSIFLKKGALGVFGKQSVDKHFDVVSIAQAKNKIKELFGHSVDSLYAKYK